MEKQNWLRRTFENSPRFWISIVLIFSDFMALAIAELLAILIWMIFVGNKSILSQYIWMYPYYSSFFISLFLLRGLYPGIAVNRIIELKLLVITITFGYLMMIAYVAFFNPVTTWKLFPVLWIISIGLVPFSRWVLRTIFIKSKMWGEPIIVFGGGKQGEMILDHLYRHQKLGLRPVAIVNGNKKTQSEFDIPVISGISWLESVEYSEKFSNVRTAILIYPEVSKSIFTVIADNQNRGFSRLIFVSSWEHLRSTWVQPVDFGGILGLEVRQNLLNQREQFFKRVLDILLVIIGSIVMLPLLILLLGLVLIDSKGKPFYRQIRIGYEGKQFQIWKFRTMFPDADKLLTAYLESHPELGLEWDNTQKLKNDPRITRLGKILRKLSLDEIPQVWNVLKGEMSIVGPRPIIETEIEKYHDVFKLYKQVKPGITGMWQVSGRNDTSYNERIRLDEYYVRNWSVWMDIYILIRTAWVLLRPRGAY